MQLKEKLINQIEKITKNLILDQILACLAQIWVHKNFLGGFYLF